MPPVTHCFWRKKWWEQWSVEGTFNCLQIQPIKLHSQDVPIHHLSVAFQIQGCSCHSNLSCCLQMAEGIKSRAFIMTQQIRKAEITNLSVHTALSHSCNDFIKCIHLNESIIGEGIPIVKGVNVLGKMLICFTENPVYVLSSKY